VKTTTAVGVTTTFGYDLSGELLTSTPSLGKVLSFAYDGAGRRTTSKVGAAATTNYTYNTASQLIGVTPAAGSPTTFTYDTAGRRLTETTGTAVTTNSFDQAGRLAGVARTSGGAVVSTEARAFTPDGLVRSDTVTGVGGALLRFMKFDWNTQTSGPAQLVSMLDGSSNTGLVRNNGGWAASTVGGKPTVVGADVFGSTLNSTGQGVANATGFDPYGVPTGAAATTAAKFGYRGELTIQGSTLLRAREYQATTGVFTTTDPLADVAGTPTSGNPYHYSYNDPINREDPSGLRPGEPDGGANRARIPLPVSSAAKLGVRVEEIVKKCPSLSLVHKATTKFWYDVNVSSGECWLVFNGHSPIPGTQWIVDHQTEVTLGLAVVAVIAGSVAVMAAGPAGLGALAAGEAGTASVGAVGGTAAVGTGAVVAFKVAAATGAVVLTVGGVTVILHDFPEGDDPEPQKKPKPGPGPRGDGGNGGTTTTTPPTCGTADGGSSPNQMNKEIERGQGPTGVERVDRADPNNPGNQDHVHFTGERATLNRDGTWGHGDGELNLTNKQREWLKRHGWCV
jgi:RHS repeat-associated protein